MKTITEMEILSRIKTSYQDILQSKLTGIYIHGSIAFGCFTWDCSDIDFLVIINQEISLREKEQLIRTLLDLDAYCPPKGLEMSVVYEKYCQHFIYPTPFELHYSNAHKESCRRNLEEYCMHMNGTDKDLAAHFMVTQKVGIVLCGKEISEVFSSVPREAYLDSIKADIENAVCEIEKDSVYIILNLCRVLAYVKEGIVLSKEQGGEWALHNLSERYCRLADQALAAYHGAEIFDAGRDDMRDFAVYMLGEI